MKPIVFATIVGLALIACDDADNTPQPEPEGGIVSVDTTSGTENQQEDSQQVETQLIQYVYQDDSTAINLSTITENVDGDFCFNIVKQLNALDEDNFLLSPISVELAFAMVANGAYGQSRQQIMDALGYGSKSIDELNNHSKNLIAEWNDMNVDNARRNSEGYYGDNLYQQTIETANAIWTDRKFPLYSDYIALCNSFFDAEASTMNFANEDSTLAVMNEWCNQKTHGMIPRMFSSLEPDLLTVIANALYFKASWEQPFDEWFTSKNDFHNADNSIQEVDMMKCQMSFNYVRTENFVMAELPYNGTTCMDIILPDSSTDISQCISELSSTRFAAATEKMLPKLLNLHLPKFDLKFDHNLVDVLKQLGITSVFGVAADLSKMGCAYENAFLSNVFQLSHISVDENGTEAAAVTVVAVANSAYIPPTKVVIPIEFNVNRPFAYIIRDTQTSTILFVGKVEKLIN